MLAYGIVLWLCHVCALWQLTTAAVGPPSAADIPFFYIADPAGPAGETMEHLINVGHVTTVALTPAASLLEAMHTNARLVNFVKSPDVHHAHWEFSYEEAAVVHAHVRTILAAEAEGHEYIVVVQGPMGLVGDCDTATPNEAWQATYDHLSKLILAAPQEWEVLSLVATNPEARFQMDHTPDVAMPWHPLHGRPLAYCISRQGMQTLRKVVFASSKPDIPVDFLVAGQLFFPMLRSFTVTCPVFRIPVVGQTRPSVCPTCIKALSWVGYNPRTKYARAKVLATQVIYADFHQAMPTVVRNVQSLTTVLPRLAWLLHVVCPPQDQPQWAAEVRKLRAAQPRLQFHLWFHPKSPMPKWMFHLTAKAYFPSFDYVLLADDDMDLGGLPIVRLLADVHTAYGSAPIISSVPRITHIRAWENIRSYESYNFTQPWMWMASGTYRIKAQPMAMLEQYFALVNASFFSWFLDKVLAPEHLAVMNATRSDWGIDSLWCAFAKAFAPRAVPCSMFPIPILHLNWIQQGRRAGSSGDTKLWDYYEDTFPDQFVSKVVPSPGSSPVRFG